MCVRLRGSALGLSDVVGKWEGCFVLFCGGEGATAAVALEQTLVSGSEV